jgi:hypothetical protein
MTERINARHASGVFLLCEKKSTKLRRRPNFDLI